MFTGVKTFKLKLTGLTIFLVALPAVPIDCYDDDEIQILWVGKWK